ncbi:Ubiquinone/menaquinone biosynthesis C-methyltransferase UbiE [Phycisphaerae bacterium RAS1]|nr:Ubiquinone/menaquinone biosynthesis C-methyltransferase UbiE [Phycisphaerae bacterium RAS1]
MSTEEREYVLGTHAAELTRLGLQHRLWSGHALALWERCGLAEGHTILDVGCGPGYATLDLAQLVGPRGRVFAVDASQRFIDRLRGECSARGVTNVEPIVADVHEYRPAAASLDGAYARWVLCFLTDPQKVVAHVAAGLRPGGFFAVQDYFNYESLCVAPRSPAFERVVAAVGESWRKHGGDPDLAGRLPAMMERCGLELREIRPILRVARPGSALWQWPTTFFSNYVPALVEMGLLTRDEQNDFEREWAERTQNPSAFFVTPPVFDIVGVKRS